MSGHEEREEQVSVLDRPFFVWFISGVILFSVGCFSLETLPNQSLEMQSFLDTAEWVIVVIFTAEYLFRLYEAKAKLRFVFSFYGIIDLLAILPFYLAFATEFQALRLFRLFRLLRVFKLVRYHKAIQRFAKALVLAREELVVFTLTSLVMLYLAAVGIYYFEHPAQPDVFRSIFDCLWWAVATLTTVGYGDIYPITTGGRIFTFAVLMIGLGLVAVPTGIVASALASTRKALKD